MIDSVDFINLILNFFVFSIIGWIFEGLLSIIRDHEIVNRGFLNGPYCPIYGTGATLFILLMHWTERPLELFFLGGIFACLLEYFTSWLMEKLFKGRWWDYSHWPFNINGRVCLYGFLTFGLFASLMPLMKQGSDTLIGLMPKDRQQRAAIASLILLIIDTAYSTQIITSFNRNLKRIQKEVTAMFPLNVINRGKHKYLILKLGGKKIKLLTWQQRRILNAFPSFTSKYDKALRALVKQSNQASVRFHNNRYKPITKAELNRAKAKAKKAGKKRPAERKSNKY